MTYDPRIHHRKSIRLKGHDYAGGGIYFVTICAHRKAGNIFASEGVKQMVGRVWESLPNVGAALVAAALDEGTHKGSPYVVMPDHFHGILHMAPHPGRGAHEGCPYAALGDVVGAFKSLVVHEYIMGVKAGNFAPFPGKVWHRNYYERIMRSTEELENVKNYIRMNPWRNVIHLNNKMRCIGNPSLWHQEKIGVLCSRNPPVGAGLVPALPALPLGTHEGSPYIGGFHSGLEKEILAALLENNARIICCPAWGIDTMKIPHEWLPALEENRMLILEMKNKDGNLTAARERNTFVMQEADSLWIPHITPNGMLDKLIQELDVGRKMISN